MRTAPTRRTRPTRPTPARPTAATTPRGRSPDRPRTTSSSDPADRGAPARLTDWAADRSTDGRRVRAGGGVAEDPEERRGSPGDRARRGPRGGAEDGTADD